MSKLPFTKEQVVAAFARHPEIKPIRCLHRVTTTNKDSAPTINACCGVSILVIDAGHSNVVAAINSDTTNVLNSYLEAMGWDHALIDDLENFVMGFDSGYPPTDYTQKFDQESYAVGRDVSNFFFPHVQQP